MKKLKQLIALAGYLLVLIGTALSLAEIGGETGLRTAIGGLAIVLYREASNRRRLERWVDRRIELADQSLQHRIDWLENAGLKEIILRDGTLDDPFAPAEYQESRDRQFQEFRDRQIEEIRDAA